MQELIKQRVQDYYWNKDLNCAVTTLRILAELFYPKLNTEVIDAAFGLNAGRCGYQCGLVEGTLMFIGCYGKHKELKKEQIAALCHEFCSNFQTQFSSMLCTELRPQGFRPDNPPHLCEGITAKAIVFAAEFLNEI